jgi:hypothetical protein
MPTANSQTIRGRQQKKKADSNNRLQLLTPTSPLVWRLFGLCYHVDITSNYGLASLFMVLVMIHR